MGLHYSNTLGYDMNGRKRKPQKARGEVYKKYIKPRNGSAPMPNYNHRSSDVFYASAEANKVTTAKTDNSYKIEASKNFTVAPAYNKGAYQVISKDNIEHIGK